LIFRKLNNHLPKSTLLFAAGALFVLSLISAYYFSVKPSVRQEEKKLEHYIHKQQKDYKNFISDSVLMRKLVQRSESLEEFKSLADKDYGIFLFAETLVGDNEIIFWNNQRILPPKADYTLADGEYFQQLANGYYLIIKNTITLSGLSNNVVSYALIPVMHLYDLQQSNYLQSHFAHDRQAINKIQISAVETPFLVHSVSGKGIFYIDRKTYTPIATGDAVTSVLRLLAFILLLAFVHFFTDSVRKKKGALKSVIILVSLLIIIRTILLLFPGIFSLRQFNLFDPTIYGTNWFNRSLGDLLINSIFFCWVAVYTWYNMGPWQSFTSFVSGKKKYLVGGLLLFALVFTTFQFAGVVRSMVADSKISFNVIDFFSLTSFTVVGFIVLALLSLTYYYFTRILFRLFFSIYEKSNNYIYFAIAFLGLVYLSFQTSNTRVLFQIPVLLWLLAYTFLLSREQSIVNKFRITIAGILFWIFIFSVSLAAVILNENREKEIIVRKGIAEKYDQLTDPSGERTISIALAYLDVRFLRDNFWRFKNPQQNAFIRDSIVSANMSGYLNRYDTKIFIFDSTTRPVNNRDALSYAELNTIFTVQSRQTEIPDLYYHETSYDQYTYITKRVINDGENTLGTFFLLSTPKKYNQEAFYPELFRRINKSDAENSPIYSYAIYNKNLLVASSSKYPFRINLLPVEVPTDEFERRIFEDNDELWYKASHNKVVVVAKKRDTLLESITLFSYLFCAFLFLVALLQAVTILLRAGDDFKEINIFWQLNIRSQVHSTIIFISVFSFIIIGVATISFFISRYNRNNVDKLSRTAGILVREMRNRVEAFGTFDDVIKIYDPVTNQNLQKLVQEVADIHNVDVNVYDLQGNLQVSSESEVYKRGILSSKMHPEAYYHLHRMRQVQYVQRETMSSLNYLSIYAAVRDENGQVYAYLNIPYFLSQIDINQEISNFLVTIINLNAFIFLLAGIIALFIANRITRSFSIIGDKMKEIRLGKTNEEIIWNRKDEIGELVKQYNKMVHQLEQSADALAKSEREGAWREMARQVAHEIKNPLTPMKLSIQFLQKAIHNNQPNVKDLTTSVTSTLVEQIDHLSKIAADFARFAHIGNLKTEVFDLHQVLENLKELFGSNPNVEFHWFRLPHPVMVKADKTHMNRLFTNLITNSIDACGGKVNCRIEIREDLIKDDILIQIKDNGEGIEEEMQSKIFTPNFTTKTSGTGLGLAMCKSIVEQADGEIWFKTTAGEGTCFYVQLPLHIT
jgi:two-component system, NtrC family, nitrogen regulation sensor histidine kinase NtrY